MSAHAGQNSCGSRGLGSTAAVEVEVSPQLLSLRSVSAASCCAPVVQALLLLPLLLLLLLQSTRPRWSCSCYHNFLSRRASNGCTHTSLSELLSSIRQPRPMVFLT